MRHLPTLTMAIACLLLGSSSQATEDFDEVGGDWSVTLFPALSLAGDGTFERRPLDVALGSPDTVPPLPINAGGDKEGRYFEFSFAGTSSYALTADSPENDLADVVIDGHIAIGLINNFGSRSAGFLVRASDSPAINAYSARMNQGTPNQMSLSLVRIRDNVITFPDVFVNSQSFPANLSAENYRLRVAVEGTTITASLWRVEAVGGLVVETPIDLLPEPGVQNTLSAVDAELATGRTGVSAFARGGNSIFYDDIEVSAIPAVPTSDFPGLIVMGLCLLIGLSGIAVRNSSGTHSRQDRSPV